MAKKKATRGITDDQRREMEFAALNNSLSKRFGGDFTKPLGQVECMPTFVDQVSTGSVKLDIAIGAMRKLPSGYWQRGIGTGLISEFFGDEGAGKTTLVARCMAEFLRRSKTDNPLYKNKAVGFIDMEKRFTSSWGARNGLVPDRLNDPKDPDMVLYKPEDGNSCAEIAKAIVPSGLFSVVGIDSVAAMTPKEILEGESDDSHVGVHARLMSQFVSAVNARLQATNTTLLFTNQMRDTIPRFGSGFGPTSTSTGGRTLRFYASYRFKVTKGAQIKVSDNDSESIGQYVNVSVVKNYGWRPNTFVKIPLNYMHGIDNYREIFELAVDHQVILQSGSWYSYDGNTIGQGAAQIVEILRSDPDLSIRILDQIFTLHLYGNGFNPDGTPIEDDGVALVRHNSGNIGVHYAQANPGQ